MGRARCQIAVMQIIRFDTGFNECPHQRFERIGIIVDAAQQHGLADDGDAGIDKF